MTYRHTILRYNRIPFHSSQGEDILQQVEQHWEKMREAGQIPARSTLAPEPLDEALSHCFVLERVAPELARIRVAGRDLTHLLGMEARSMPLGALFSVAGREALGPLIEQVLDGPHVVEAPLVSSRGFARTPVKARLLMMPLADRNGATTRIFGALVTDSKPLRGGWRFDFDDSLPMRCKRVLTRPQNKVAKAAKPQTYPIAPTPADAPATPLRQRPHLRLVVDNTKDEAFA